MQEGKYMDLRHKTVVKSNALIQNSRFSLSAQQQKIMLFLIAQVSPFDDDFKTYKFSIPEFCRVCGICERSGKNYQELKQALKTLADKSVWVCLDGRHETLLRWIEKPTIDKDEDILSIRLDKDMKPFLLQLQANFTQYELIWALHFRSKFTIRLYELICSVHYHELKPYQRRYSVDELKRLVDGENYVEYRDFKNRALLPAIEEINRYSNKKVEIEEVKNGRKTVAIEFTISGRDSLTSAKICSEIEHELGMDRPTAWDWMIEHGLEKHLGDWKPDI